MQNDSISKLNSLLQGEISAVETYKKAVETTDNMSIRSQLELVQGEHGKRAQRLRNRIEQLGGTPAESSGLWGAFAKTVEAGATVIGDQAAINVLEEGEDRGLDDYRKNLGEVDEESRRLIESELLPGQEQTHQVISTLKKQGAV